MPTSSQYGPWRNQEDRLNPISTVYCLSLQMSTGPIPLTLSTQTRTKKRDGTQKSHLLVSMSESMVEAFKTGYEEDNFLKSRYVDEVPNSQTAVTPSHFRTGKNGLLYFVDADWSARLCVPKSQVNYVLKWIHDSV